MIVPLAEYPFKGPLKTTRTLKDEPGAFAVISEFVDKNYLLDVDCAEYIKKEIESHQRRKCWEKFRKGNIAYIVLYESDFPSIPKEKIVDEVRRRYKTVPCGEVPGGGR